MRTFVLACCLLLCTAGAALAQQPAPFTPLPEFKPPQMPIVPPWDAFVFTEPVKGFDIPVDITLLETVDGLYHADRVASPAGQGAVPHRDVLQRQRRVRRKGGARSRQQRGGVHYEIAT